MTLVDSRPGIAATFRLVSRLGPPLEHEMANWYPPADVGLAVDRYRTLYPEHAVAPSPALPGAAEAIDAVHAAGGRVLVLTAKQGELVDAGADAVLADLRGFPSLLARIRLGRGVSDD